MSRPPFYKDMNDFSQGLLFLACNLWPRLEKENPKYKGAWLEDVWCFLGNSCIAPMSWSQPWGFCMVIFSVPTQADWEHSLFYCSPYWFEVTGSWRIEMKQGKWKRLHFEGITRGSLRALIWGRKAVRWACLSVSLVVLGKCSCSS